MATSRNGSVDYKTRKTSKIPGSTRSVKSQQSPTKRKKSPIKQKPTAVQPEEKNPKMEANDEIFELLSCVDTEFGSEGWENSSMASYCSSSKITEIMDSLKLLEKEEELPQLKKEPIEFEKRDEIEGKLGQVLKFLEEAGKKERLTELNVELAKRNQSLNEEITNNVIEENNLRMEKASQTAAQLSDYLLRQQKENEEKESMIETLRHALENQKEIFERQKNEYKTKTIKSMELRKNEDEGKINSHLSFIDKLIDDKKKLTERCEQLVIQLRTIEEKYSRKISVMAENHKLELSKISEKSEISTRLRQERWIAENTGRIKELTIKGLEPEIKKLITKHKQEMRNLKTVHEAEVKAADQRVSERYAKLTEELRDQLSSEKEAACTRERELAKRSYEKQYEQEVVALENYRKKLSEQVEEEKERLESHYKKMKDEMDSRIGRMTEDHDKTVEMMRQEFDKSKEDQESRHEVEMRCFREKINAEKEMWSQTFIKQQEIRLMEYERGIRENARTDRDHQIELAIAKLEEETRKQLEENRRTEENRINRMRERYETIQAEIETSEKDTMKKYNELKGQYYELENDAERLKGALKKKDYEIEEREKKLEIFNTEKDRLAEIVRQEFIERLIRTDEENRRLINEKTEISTKAKLDVERMRAANEVSLRQKEEELQQVHEMVKKALEKRDDVVKNLKDQYEAALRRADHLESLMIQQKRDLLKK